MPGRPSTGLTTPGHSRGPSTRARAAWRDCRRRWSRRRPCFAECASCSPLAGIARWMGSSVPGCGAVFDGVSEEPGGRAEILVHDGRIAAIDRSVEHPDGAEVIDLSERTVCPGFIDTHVHLTMDAAELGGQTLASSSTKALKGLSLAQEYLRYGFTTLRDLGTMDPEFPTVDLRDALNAQ